MTNLFDSSSNDEGGSIGTRESRNSFIGEDVDDNNVALHETGVPTLPVATVFNTNNPGSNDITHYHETNQIIDAEEERDKLRITSSLMDDDTSNDSDNDDGEANTSSLQAQRKDIFRSPRKGPPTNKSAYISLSSWNTINLLDEASQSQAESEVIHRTQSYSDKFNSVYGEVATAAASKNKVATRSNDHGNRLRNARASFSTAIKTFGAGLTNATTCDAVGTTFPMVASSWDVDIDDSSHVLGKKRTADNRFSIGSYNSINNNKRRKKVPLDIRSELVLMQDKMDQYEQTIQTLRRDNAVLLTSKSHLQSMLEQSNKALRSAQQETKASKNRAESLTYQVDEMKRELERAKQHELQAQTEIDEARMEEQIKLAELKSKHELLFQKELHKQKNEIASLKSQISSAEQSVVECEDVINRQAAKIINLEETLAKTTTAATDALEVAKEAQEERDFWKSRAKLSPKAKSLAKSFVHTTRYYSCGQEEKMTSKQSVGKENNHASGKCNFCFKEQSGIVRWCKCGKVDCHMWAHAKCIAKVKKNVSTSVSHPGTPPPTLPLILCNGVEPLIKK